MDAEVINFDAAKTGPRAAAAIAKKGTRMKSKGKGLRKPDKEFQTPKRQKGNQSVKGSNEDTSERTPAENDSTRMNSSTLAEQMIKFEAKHEAHFQKMLRILKFKHRKSIMITQIKQ